MSVIAEAIKGMSGPEIVTYLGAFKWKAAGEDPQPLAPGDEGYGAYYADVRDQGVGFTPGTWDEVRFLWNTGVIDDDTYQAAYREFVGGAAGEPAASSGGDGDADPAGGADGDAGASGIDGGPAEGKRLAFARTT